METYYLDHENDYYEWDEDPMPWEHVEDYCDWCEIEGHTFRSCPRRDDV